MAAGKLLKMLVIPPWSPGHGVRTPCSSVPSVHKHSNIPMQHEKVVETQRRMKYVILLHRTKQTYSMASGSKRLERMLNAYACFLILNHFLAEEAVDILV